MRHALRAVEGTEAGGKGGVSCGKGDEGATFYPDAGSGGGIEDEAVALAEQVVQAAVGVGRGGALFLRMGVGGNPGKVAADEVFDVGTAAARRVREVEGAAAVHAEAQAAVVAARRAQVDAVGVVLVGDVESLHGRRVVAVQAVATVAPSSKTSVFSGQRRAARR